VPLVVISQDVFPEIAIELGRLRNPFAIGVLRQLIHAYLRRADRVVAIGETMRGRLEQKGADPQRVRVIQNWVDTQRIVPAARDNDWAQSHGLVGKFVVMHSGNIGHAQSLETLIRATTFLRDLDDLVVMIIGAGARQHELMRLTSMLEADCVRFLGYQPEELLAQSLSSADVHFVGLGLGLAGYVVPSRVYGILAAGRPLLAAVEETSETAGVVREANCGVVLPPDQPDRLAAAIRSAHDGELDLAGMGPRAREYALARATRELAVGRYRELLAELVDPRRRS
jgi:colanic acid biosynthesis glycosyl transferase WcaI